MIAEPLEVAEGCIEVPDGPGLGVEVGSIGSGDQRERYCSVSRIPESIGSSRWKPVPVELIDESSPLFAGREPLEDRLRTAERQSIVASPGVVPWEIQSVDVTASVRRVGSDDVDVGSVIRWDEAVHAELVGCPCFWWSASRPDEHPTPALLPQVNGFREPRATVRADRTARFRPLLPVSHRDTDDFDRW